MTLNDALRLGPLNLPVRYLLVLVAVAAAYTTMSLVFRKRSELRRASANRIANSLLLFLVIWKLEPLAAEFVTGLVRGNLDWGSVWYAIFLPGGSLASIAGAIAVAAYLAASIIGTTGLRAPTGRRQALMNAVALTPALASMLLVYVLGSALLSPPAVAPRGPGSPATAKVTAVARPVGAQIGDQAPRFSAVTLSGNQLNLGQSDGKTIVLNFWATWCPPCRAELPELARFASSPHRIPVEVWGVDMTSSETSLATVRRFAQSHHLDFPVLLDRAGSLARAYGVAAVPTTFIISPDGTILAKQVGAMSPGWLRDQLNR